MKSAATPKLGQTNAKPKGKKRRYGKVLVMRLAALIKMYILKAGFLDGKQGFLLAVLSAHSTFVKYADLWERNQH